MKKNAPMKYLVKKLKPSTTYVVSVKSYLDWSGKFSDSSEEREFITGSKPNGWIHLPSVRSRRFSMCMQAHKKSYSCYKPASPLSALILLLHITTSCGPTVGVLSSAVDSVQDLLLLRVLAVNLLTSRPGFRTPSVKSSPTSCHQPQWPLVCLQNQTKIVVYSLLVLDPLILTTRRIRAVLVYSNTICQTSLRPRHRRKCFVSLHTIIVRVIVLPVWTNQFFICQQTCHINSAVNCLDTALCPPSQLPPTNVVPCRTSAHVTTRWLLQICGRKS